MTHLGCELGMRHDKRASRLDGGGLAGLGSQPGVWGPSDQSQGRVMGGGGEGRCDPHCDGESRGKERGDVRSCGKGIRRPRLEGSLQRSGGAVHLREVQGGRRGRGSETAWPGQRVPSAPPGRGLLAGRSWEGDFSEAHAGACRVESTAHCPALRWETALGSLLRTWPVSSSHTPALPIGSASLQTRPPASLPSGASQAGPCPGAFAPIISLPAVFSPRSWHDGPFSAHPA